MRKVKESTISTARPISELLPAMLKSIDKNYKQQPDKIIKGWPEIVGEKMAPMAKAISFKEGVLFVKVSNSTLYSLLAQQERPRLLKKLKEKCPSVAIQNIVFRMG